jgi:molybdopterin/thiamine biosynthesis adenylyltransferase
VIWDWLVIRSFLCKDAVKHLVLSGVGRLRLCPLSVAQREANSAGSDQTTASPPPDDDETTMQSVEAVATMVKELNPDVHVEVCRAAAFQSNAVLAINVPTDAQLQLNECCRRNGVRYTSCATAGLAGFVFNDFGDDVKVCDATGKLLGTQRHRSLREVLRKPRFTAFDSSAEPRRLTKLQHALFGYWMQRGGDTVPPLTRRQLAEDIRNTLAEIGGEELTDGKAIDAVYDCISEPLHAANVAISAVVAAIAAQQCITALTHVFAPIDQMMPLAFPEASTANDSDGPVEAAERLAQLRVLLVGASAIGCELLKNLGAMGVSTDGSGAVFVTDYDTVSLSNLSRQLLFRMRDVGAMKASTAAAAMKQLAPRMRVKPMHTRVSKDMEQPLPDQFWQSMDVVLMGVDNVEARRDVDDYCVRYGLPLLDSGTLGAQASTQAIIPEQTESYSASSDPADSSTPVCTIKTFPTSTEHTILWGKEAFTELFFNEPSLLQRAIEMNATALVNSNNDARAAENLAQMLEVEVGTAQAVLGTMRLLFVVHKDMRIAIQFCLRQMVATFERWFDLDMQDLLRQHPPDSLDEDGFPFWNDGRRKPTPMRLDFANPTIREFVTTGAFLRLLTLGAAAGDLSAETTGRLWKAIQVEYERLAAVRAAYQPAVHIQPTFNMSQAAVQPLEFDKVSMQ